MILSELTDAPEDLEKLRAFYDGVYTSEFPDPDERELLENMEHYLQLKSAGWYGQNNYHILILQSDEGEICGGVVADYFARSNCGVLEFMVLDIMWRAKGLGKMILLKITQQFHLDAERAQRAPLAGIAGEVNDPYRRCDVQEHLDGFARMRMWDRFGFRLLDFPYVQPALSEGQEAVSGLGLMFRPETDNAASSVSAALVEQLVEDYQIWAMRIPDPSQHEEFCTMQRYLRNQTTVNLLNMRTYVCEEDNPPLKVVEIRSGDLEALEQFTQIYKEAFPNEATAVDVSEFRHGTRVVKDSYPVHHYWLWGFSPGSDKEILSGLASFFSFPNCGFGGYIALSGVLRGNGHLRTALRLMERQIVSVNNEASGWYVECEPGTSEAQIFKMCGFEEIPMIYRQPRLHTDISGTSDGKVLTLLYKPFGRIYLVPSLSLFELQRDLHQILTRIYHLDAITLEQAMSRMTWPRNDGNVFLNQAT